MHETGTELEKWLAQSEWLPLQNDIRGDESWDPGFEIDRQVVVTQVGKVYQKVFLRPDNFVKRFYHQVFRLPVEDWQYQEEIDLFEGFCHVSVNIELRFQATLAYAQRNIEHLDSINHAIKRQIKTLLVDIVHQHLQQLGDGVWVEHGLQPIERKMATEINERLMMQHILPRAICHLQVRFDEFPGIQPGKDNVFLHVLKKNYQNREEKNRAFFQQKNRLHEQRLAHKRQQLEKVRQYAEIEREKRAIEAEMELLLLNEKEKKLADKLELKKKIHAEKARHKQALKELEIEYEVRLKQKQKTEKRQAESQDLAEALAHQAELMEKRQQAELDRQDRQQHYKALLHEKKVQAEIERYEKQQQTWREAKLRVHQEQLMLKQREKEIEAEVEEEFRRLQKLEQEKHIVMPFQKLDKFIGEDLSRQRTEALKEEAKLAVLEKQRLELDLAIEEAKKNKPGP